MEKVVEKANKCGHCKMHTNVHRSRFCGVVNFRNDFGHNGFNKHSVIHIGT